MALSFMLDSAPAAGLVSVGDCRPQTSSAARAAMKESPPPPAAHGSNEDSRHPIESQSTPDHTASRLPPTPNAVAAAAAAAAALSGLPLLPPHLLRGAPASLLAASTRAALMALPPGLTPPQLPDPSTGGVPVSLHATLASGPALFPHAPRAMFDWRNGDTGKQALVPAPSPPVAHAAPVNKKRSNGRIYRSGAKRATKVEAESTTIDLGAATPVTILPSPPTSGSSPPSNASSEGSGGERGRKGGSTSATTTTSSAAVSSAGGTQGDAGRDKVFVCGICYRSFGYKHVLQNHERTHTGEKPFECRECHKRFTRDHHLKTHMRLHTGEKPYHCTHCDRQFVQVANLRRHLRVHTGERPYACELCSSRFSDSNQLKAHTLIHKGEKPFQCGRCWGRFRRRHHLLHHKCPRGEEPIGEVGEEEEDEEEEEEEEVAVGRRRTTRVAASRRRAPPSSSSPDDLEEDLTEEGEEDGSSGKCPEEEEEEEDLMGDEERGEDAMDEDECPTMKRLLKRRERKSRDIRRVIRLPAAEGKPSSQLPAAHMPEQTEPEDLSVRRGTPEKRSPDNPFAPCPSSSSGSPPSAPLPLHGEMPSRSDEEDEEMDPSKESILASLQNGRTASGSSAFLAPAHYRHHLKFRRHHHHALHPLHHVRHHQNGSAPVS